MAVSEEEAIAATNDEADSTSLIADGIEVDGGSSVTVRITGSLTGAEAVLLKHTDGTPIVERGPGGAPVSHELRQGMTTVQVSGPLKFNIFKTATVASVGVKYQYS